MSFDRLMYVATCMLLMLGCGADSATSTAERISTQSAYVLVVEDDNSLKQTGNTNYRAMYTKALRRLRGSGVKSIAFKYFFFDDTNSLVDVAFAQHISGVPTLLQYALRGDPEASQNPLIMMDKMKANVEHIDAPRLLTDLHTQIPINLFAAPSIRLGFVDVVEPFDAKLIPLLGRYKAFPVESLMLQLIEEQYGNSTTEVDGVHVSGRKLQIDSYGRHYCSVDTLAAPSSITLTKLVMSPERIDVRGKTVIFVYEGDQSPTIKTGFLKRVKLHTLFISQLMCIEEELQRAKRAAHQNL